MRNKKDPASPRTITSCVRVDLVRPLGESWDEASPQLYALSDVAHRAMNAAIEEMLCAERAKSDVHPATLAYRAVNAAVEEDSKYWRGVLEKAATKKDPRLLATAKARADLYVPSIVAVSWSSMAFDQFQKWRKQRLRGDMRLPSFRRGAPITIGAKGWSLEKDGKGYVLRAQLAGEPRHPRSMRFAVGADGPSAHAMLRLAASGAQDVKPGDCRIVREERRSRLDGKKRSVWSARLVVTRPAPTSAVDPAKKMAVHRGIRVFLTAATSDGYTDAIDDGTKLLAFKAQMLRRRRAWYGYKKSNAKRSRGRGWWRRFEMYRKLEDTERNFTRSFVRERAAWIVKKAARLGCGTIVIEDYSAKKLADQSGSERAERLVRRFPFAELAGAIEWDAKKAGLRFETAPSAYISVTCPKCGNVDSAQDGGHGTFECSNSACGIRRSVDAVAAWNMLRSHGGGVAPGFDEHAAGAVAFASKARERSRGVKKAGAARGSGSPNNHASMGGSEELGGGEEELSSELEMAGARGSGAGAA